MCPTGELPPAPPNQIIHDWFGETKASKRLGKHYESMMRRWPFMDDAHRIAAAELLQVHVDLVRDGRGLLDH